MTLETLNDSVQTLKNDFDQHLHLQPMSEAALDLDDTRDESAASTGYTLLGRDIIPIAKNHNWEVRPDRGDAKRLCHSGYRTLHIPLDRELKDPHKTLMAIFQPTLRKLIQADLGTVEMRVQALIEALSPEIVIRQTQVMQDLAAYEAAERDRLAQYRLDAEEACRVELAEQLEADKADLLAAYEEELRELLNDSAEVQRLSAELEAAQRRNATLVAERQTLLADLDSQAQAIADRNVTIAEQASELGQTQLRLHNTEAELNELRDRWTTLQAEQAELSERFAQLSADYDALQGQKIALESQLQAQETTITELQSQLSERSGQLAATSAELATTQADRDQAQHTAAELTLKLSQAEATIISLANIKSELDIVKTNCSELASQNQHLQTEASQLNTEIKHWQAEYEASTQQSQERQQTLATTQAELADVRTESEQLLTRQSELQAELERWQGILQLDDSRLFERVQALKITSAPKLKGLRKLIFGAALAIALLGMGWVSGLMQNTSATETAPETEDVAAD